MQRRVDQADDDRAGRSSPEQAVEVTALEGQQLVQGAGALFADLGQDHALHDRQAIFLEEHVLGAAEANALGAEVAGPWASLG